MRPLVQSLVAALCFTAASSFAEEPTSVGQQLGAARERYHRAAAGLSTAQAAVSKAHASLRSCRNGRAQLAFSSALTRLEASRKTLEKGRRETEAFRRQLEAARARIEAGHHLKHESLEEREAKERHYLERLSQDYVAPLGHVADLLESYTAGVAGYSDVLERYATFCATPGLTDTSSQAFVATLTPSLEALDGKARALVTEASEGASVGVSSK